MKHQRKNNEVPASLKTINIKAIMRKRGIYVKQKLNKQLKQAAMPVARELIKGKKNRKNKTAPAPKPQKYISFTDEQALSYWEKQVHKIDIVEEKFDKRVQQFITTMVSKFMDHLDNEIAKKSFKMKGFKAKDYFDDEEDELLRVAQLDFTPLLTDLATLAGQEAMNLVAQKEIYLPELLRKKISENVTKFTKSMLDTDRDKLVAIIQEGLEKGRSVNEIRDVIARDFAEFSKSQAERITRTEVSRVSNQAALDAWEQSGVVEGKQWVVYQGGDDCDNYDGQVVALKGNFYGDTDEFADGDPPLHPNCKCGTVPVLIDE